MTTTTCRSFIIGFLFIFPMMLTRVENAAARGAGIVAGEGRLHPSLDLELAYDTNPGYFINGDNAKTGDLVLRIHPGITILYPSEMVSVDITGTVGYDWYMGVSKKETRDLSSVVASGDINIGFNPNGQFSFFFEDVLSRSGDPRYTTLTQKLNRTNNEAKAHFQLKPGGQALTFDLAYGFYFDLFDDLKALSSYAHRIYFSGKWKFLPKTALLIDFDADLRRYPNKYTQIDESNIDLNGIRAYVGMLGQITPALSLLVKVGYGDTLIDKSSNATSTYTYSGSDYRSVIAQAEVNFRFGTTYLKGGYLRNFQPNMFFPYYGQDRLYLNFIQQIAVKFMIRADIGFDFLEYGKDIRHDPNLSSTRSDKFLAGNLLVGYNILDWLNVGLRYDFQVLFSDYMQQPGNTGVEYTKHVFTLVVGIDY